MSEIMRAGRKLSQVPGSLVTLYRVTGGDPDDDECIGIASSPEVAQAICDAVNNLGAPLPCLPLVPLRILKRTRTNTLRVRFRCLKTTDGGICSAWETGRGQAEVQQTLYWTKFGTLACCGCGAQATGDGKASPYVIDHDVRCETVPDSALRCAV